MKEQVQPASTKRNDNKHGNDVIHKSKFFLDALMENTSDYIYFKDENSRFLKTSRSQIDSFGLEKPDDIIGKTDFDFFDEKHARKAYEDEQKIIATGVPMINMEEEEIRLKGLETWASTSKWPLRDDTGHVIGTFGISRDISQKIRDERKLQAYSEELAKLNATKDKFFSIIAHDLKNPLMALLGFSDLVALSIEQNDINMIKKNVKIIKKASYQALELLSNLLDWARSQTGNIVFNPEMINLGTLSEDIVSLFFETARQKGISLCTSVPKDLFVFSDKSMTGIVLRNLVSNAIKFSCSGEKVEILAEEKEDIVEISVKDNGIGLSKEEISKLFSVTSQFTKPGSAKERGTGLGLILCKEFAEKQGGRIWVVSKPGKGSTFTFSIPKI
jgi:two-component system, sensor histidine kinase and response regulator